jgi:HTH-type transcriptional regulator, competence development regulator
MANKITLGQTIRNMRNLRAETLHQVAKNTDIDMTMLSKLERGERLPTNEQMKRIAKYYETNEDDLMTLLTAEKIIKVYGANEMTLNAISLVQEQILPYLKK